MKDDPRRFPAAGAVGEYEDLDEHGDYPQRVDWRGFLGYLLLLIAVPIVIGLAGRLR